MAVMPEMFAALPTGNANLCISVASRPSQFGVTVHNAGYRALGLDFFYKAFGVVDDVAGIAAAVRLLHIRGCSVSMPFKRTIIPYLDVLDSEAAVIGAVNTVVNDGNRLTGYNTDTVGAASALDALGGQVNRVLLLGAGGVARAIVRVLQQRGTAEIIIAARRREAATELAAMFGVRSVAWEERDRITAELLINATPIGMAPDAARMPLPPEALTAFGGVIDVVATPPFSLLITTAKAAGISAIDGLTMSLYQAAAQFRLYTGHEAPFDVMRNAALTLL